MGYINEMGYMVEREFINGVWKEGNWWGNHSEFLVYEEGRAYAKDENGQWYSIDMEENPIG